MGDTESRKAASHLKEAMRHLTVGRALIGHLEAEAELTPADRIRLNELTSGVGFVQQEITDTLLGRSLDSELATFLARTETDDSSTDSSP